MATQALIDKLQFLTDVQSLMQAAGVPALPNGSTLSQLELAAMDAAIGHDHTPAQFADDVLAERERISRQRRAKLVCPTCGGANHYCDRCDGEGEIDDDAAVAERQGLARGLDRFYGAGSAAESRGGVR